MSNGKILVSDGTNAVRMATITIPPGFSNDVHTIKINETMWDTECKSKTDSFKEEDIHSLLNDGMKYRLLKNAELLKKKMLDIEKPLIKPKPSDKNKQA